jgi:hypothetical protein
MRAEWFRSSPLNKGWRSCVSMTLEVSALFMKGELTNRRVDRFYGRLSSPGSQKSLCRSLLKGQAIPFLG